MSDSDVIIIADGKVKKKILVKGTGTENPPNNSDVTGIYT